MATPHFSSRPHVALFALRDDTDTDEHAYAEWMRQHPAEAAADRSPGSPLSRAAWRLFVSVYVPIAWTLMLPVMIVHCWISMQSLGRSLEKTGRRYQDPTDYPW